MLQDFNTANDQLYASAWKSQFLSGLMMPIMNFVGNLGYVAVAIVGSIFAAGGLITIGDIQAFIQYVKNFTQPIQQLSQVSNMLQSMAAAAERVFEFLAEEEEDQTADPARRTDPATIDGQVTFDHVKFGYTPEKTVIRDFSCKVQPGQKVAIVGPTGAGKTTMVKLLMRFYDVDSGSITLNGHDVRDFDRSALREGFGMVPAGHLAVPGAPSWRTSATAVWMPPTRRSSPRRKRPVPTTSSARCPAATRWS